MKRVTYIKYVILLAIIEGCMGSKSAEKLYYDLMRGYDELIRPVENVTEPVIVKFGVSISQLIDVDEKNQILVTSVWVKQEWHDFKLTWDPEEYDGLESIRIPIEQLWRPDFVLYNNADGDYDMQFMTNAIVGYKGDVFWMPPAIFKTSCLIEIEFFPFDEQLCKMKFGSWTHDSKYIDMAKLSGSVDLEDYWPNGEWAIMEAPINRHNLSYPCCPNEFYIDITVEFVIHRKPLFYVVTLVIPCLLISFLTILVFYLPSDAQEKITLSISILLALIVFLLLIPSIIPPTSNNLPLIGRYMLFTMGLVTASIFVTVVVINIHFRSATTHEMPQWIRKVFLQTLPTILCMSRPGGVQLCDGCKTPRAKRTSLNGVPFHPIWVGPDMKLSTKYMMNTITPSLLEEIQQRDNGGECSNKNELPTECREAVDSIEYIASHLKLYDENNLISEDWKYVAMVIDRIFLWVFAVLCTSGTLGIILNSPMLWEPEGKHNTTIPVPPEILHSVTYSEP
ncbi:neuronal acetylcholine receptor subunit alpha-4-like [Anneissia japonica]|uniref:neuronal acetylcholine receptor subunit alpha-4-like n=1 Tax=Anneissia japonica TaxID=1529436 RepID=UPI001425546B|nr:neuronal acetylcholine receptor subunit alpha-4-like [Anneissia japonica]